MNSLCHFDTKHFKILRRAALLGALPLISLAVPATAWAQDSEENLPVELTCKDQSKLSALFSENGVDVTLADGTKLNLPFKGEDPFVVYSNGKYQLNDKGEVLEWVVGKKAPVECLPDEAEVPTQFDPPVAVDNLDLPKDPANPDARPAINCYRFDSFMVKEVDLGEVGAEKLALLPKDGKCVRDDPTEKPVKDDISGYFLGAKAGFAFFQAADGINGGMPFTVYDAATATKLFQDSFDGDDFETITAEGKVLTLKYRRSFAADCSMYLDASACGESIKKSTGLGTVAKLPECGAVYDAEKKRTPDYATEIEQIPSIISYEAELTWDGTKVSVVPLEGETSCRLPD